MKDRPSVKTRIYLTLLIIIGVWMSIGMFVSLVRDSSKVANWGRSGEFETDIDISGDDSVLVFDDLEAADFAEGRIPSDGDTLLTINGHPATVAVRDSLVNFAKPVGYPLDITFQHSGQQYDAEMITRPVPRGQFYMMLGMHVLRFLIGYTFLVVGFIALSRQYAAAGARALVLFTFGMASFALFAISYLNDYYINVWVNAPPWIIDSLSFFTVFIGAFWINLNLLFPHKSKIMERAPWLGYMICYVTPILVFIVDRMGASFTDTFASMNLGVQMAIGFTLLSIHYSRAQSALEKRQTKLVLYGAAIAFSPLLLMLLISLPFPNYLNQMGLEGALLMLNVVMLCLLAMPITILYAITRYGLLDVEAKLRRGTRHFLITAGVLAAFFTIVYFAGDLLIGNLQMESRTPTILIAMVLTLAVHPAQRKLTEIIERQFYPARYQLNAMLEDLTERLSSFPDRAMLWKQISSRLRHAVGVERVLPVIRTQDNRFTVFQGEISPFTMNDDLIKRLEGDRRPILLDEAMASMRIPFTDGQIRWISQNQVNLLLPMFVRGRLVGFVALGRSTRGQDYTPEIVQSLHSMMQQVALSADNLRLLEDNLEKKRLEEELKLARSIQEGFLPQNIPDTPGLDIGARSRFSLEVAGDYFDVIALPDNRTVIALGDVSGKGAGAALIMANLQASLRALVKVNADLAALVASINDIICQNTPIEEYITFVTGMFDPNTSAFTYINAGHNPPLVFRSTGEVETLDEGGIVLGVMPGFVYDVGKVELRDGDRLFFYTDGVSEAMNANGEEFGEERIYDFLAKNNQHSCSGVVEHLENEVLRFHGKPNLEDDCTMVLALVTSSDKAVELEVADTAAQLA
ncbi:PP2C family protein-serine/threonine phosphatase [bacterium]|nr:PP2C family protein-serine/threonine phosphatase [bacterium]